jgi:regulatory protein
LRLLARRERSRLELESSLGPHAPDADELKRVLDDLAAAGLLSERRLVEQVAHARRARYGSQRIRRELIERGVPETAVAASMAELAAGDFDAARRIWTRKFGAAPRNAAERARQVRFLQGRGFALDTIMQVIRSQGSNDERA